MLLNEFNLPAQMVLARRFSDASHPSLQMSRLGWLWVIATLGIGRGTDFRMEGVKTVALRLDGKKAIVAEVNESAKAALSVVVADSRGVTVSAMTDLRKQARENGVELRVVRNTLARRALEGTSYDVLNESFVGPTLLAFSMEHPGAGARLLKEFAKGQDNFEVKALAYEGELIPAEQIDRLATLPTLDEALAKLLSVMKEASAGKLARTLAALRDKKQEEEAA
ncbi:hypothetical protein LMG33818_002369 [Halomonadaceae bacterium LMG 33818]